MVSLAPSATSTSSTPVSIGRFLFFLEVSNGCLMCDRDDEWARLWEKIPSPGESHPGFDLDLPPYWSYREFVGGIGRGDWGVGSER